VRYQAVALRNTTAVLPTALKRVLVGALPGVGSWTLSATLPAVAAAPTMGRVIAKRAVVALQHEARIRGAFLLSRNWADAAINHVMPFAEFAAFARHLTERAMGTGLDGKAANSCLGPPVVGRAFVLLAVGGIGGGPFSTLVMLHAGSFLPAVLTVGAGKHNFLGGVDFRPVTFLGAGEVDLLAVGSVFVAPFAVGIAMARNFSVKAVRTGFLAKKVGLRCGPTVVGRTLDLLDLVAFSVVDLGPFAVVVAVAHGEASEPGRARLLADEAR
jgi:hypothetical protein